MASRTTLSLLAALGLTGCESQRVPAPLPAPAAEPAPKAVPEASAEALIEELRGAESLSVERLLQLADRAQDEALRDQLLVEGCVELDSDPDLSETAALLARATSLEALKALAGQCLPFCDDGSDEALAKLLMNLPDDEQRRRLVLDVLRPAGLLADSRRFAALCAMRSDRARGRLAEALILELDRLDLDELYAFVEPIAFDVNRVPVIAAGLPLLELFFGEDLLAVLSWMAGDSGRESLLVAAVPRLEMLFFEEALNAAAQFGGESARVRALSLLATAGDLTASAPELIRVCDLVSEEVHRLAVLALVVPFLEGALPVEDARTLIEAFAFDAGRLKAIEALAVGLRELPAEDCELLLSMLQHAETRRRARQLLEL